MAEIKKYKKRSADEILRMKSFYDAGKTLSEVAARFGISRSRVDQLFRQNNIRTRRLTVSKKFLAAMDRRRIILSKDTLTELYTKEKLSIKKTADRLNVSTHAVLRNLRDYGIPIRPLENYTRSRLTAELLRTLYLDKNLTAAQIADRLGYSTPSIGKKLSLLGIKKRVLARRKSSPPPPPGEPPTNVLPHEHPVSRQDARVDWSPEPPPFLTLEKIAERCGLHLKTVRKMIRDGVFPNAVREIKGKIRRWLVPSADLENFVPRGRGGRRKSAPSATAIRARRRYARKKIEISHGYGKSEIRQMIDLETEGLSRAEIAVRYRLDEKIVADLLDPITLRKSRPKKKPPGGRTVKRLPEKDLIKLYVNGNFSNAYILEKLNTNENMLYNSLRHYGIPLRDARRRTAARENGTLLYRLAFEEKISPPEIAARLQITESHVRRKINEINRRLKLKESSGDPL